MTRLTKGGKKTIRKTRKFNKRVFHWDGTFQSKGKAKTQQQFQKRQGRRARVTKSKQGYSVYST